MFSVSITHHSKIRELSNGNRVIVVPNGFLDMGPTIFELWVMKTELWLMEIDNPNYSPLPLLIFLTKNIYNNSKFPILKTKVIMGLGLE